MNEYVRLQKYLKNDDKIRNINIKIQIYYNYNY